MLGRCNISKALVLSGGGARGCFQAGAVAALASWGYSFDVICGVSTGALSAVMLAESKDLKAQSAKLLSLYQGITGNSSVYTNRFLGTPGLLVQSSIYDPSPIFHELAMQVDPKAVALNGVLFRCGVTNLDQGIYATVTEKTDRLLDYVRASASMPCFFPNVVINKDHWCDGGVVHQTPLDEGFKALADLRKASPSSGEAAMANADEMVVVLCDPVPVGGIALSSYGTGLKILPRVVDIMTWNKYTADLANACLANNAALAGQHRKTASGRVQQYVKLSVIAPDTALPGDTLSFKPADLDAGIALGKSAQVHDQAWLATRLGLA
jgi:hypothetical protein